MSVAALSALLCACAGTPVEGEQGAGTGGSTGKPGGSESTLGSGGMTTGGVLPTGSGGTSGGTRATTMASVTGLRTSGPTGTSSAESSGSSTTSIAICHPVLAEVYGEVQSDDNEREWVKLFNPCSLDVDLSNYSIGYTGNGGTSYGWGKFQLAGQIGPNTCFLVGGPDSVPENYMPNFDQALDFSPNIEDSPSDGPTFGMGLFDLTADLIDGATPVDALIYGTSNGIGILNELGVAPAPYVQGDGSSSSMTRTTAAASGWTLVSPPDPNGCTLAN